MSKILAKVECGQPPNTIHTLADWYQWRKLETERMAKETAEQTVASLELLEGAIKH